MHNDAVDGMGKLELARRTIWNRAAYDEPRERRRAHRAEVVHFHNTFPLISPAGYRAAHDAGAAVVQTLHNYRLLCPDGDVLPRRRRVRGLPGQVRPLARRGAQVLPRQPRGQRGRSRRC